MQSLVELPKDGSLMRTMPLSSLRPATDNPRHHTMAQVDAIAESIRRHGWLVPVVADSNGILIAGHGRYKAARRLKMENITVIVVDADWPDWKKKAYMLADNRLAEMSQWDNAALLPELTYLESMGVNADDVWLDESLKHDEDEIRDRFRKGKLKAADGIADRYFDAAKRQQEKIAENGDAGEELKCPQCGEHFNAVFYKVNEPVKAEGE